jgi:hypothetical protein
MQTAQHRLGFYVPCPLRPGCCLAWERDLLGEALMRSLGVEVGDVRAQSAAEVGLAHDEQVIKALPVLCSLPTSSTAWPKGEDLIHQSQIDQAL